ncbi:MAG: hypothetical protein ACRCYS_20175, partial [Beijerinckiaceae bacterium]
MGLRHLFDASANVTDPPVEIGFKLVAVALTSFDGCLGSRLDAVLEPLHRVANGAQFVMASARLDAVIERIKAAGDMLKGVRQARIALGRLTGVYGTLPVFGITDPALDGGQRLFRASSGRLLPTVAARRRTFFIGLKITVVPPGIA